jgi:Flp pilus assembly protein TadD
MLAQAADLRNDRAAAESYLAKVDNPAQAVQVQARRASWLVRQGRTNEALALIRQVPERGAEDARLKLLAEGQVFREAKRWQEAYEVARTAAQRWPNDVELIYEQAMMAEKIQRLPEMEQLLRRVIELQPDHQHAYNALGYSLADRGLRLNEARDLIRKALEFAPGDPFITDSLGWVEYRLGNVPEALKLLRQAYAARPDTEIAAHLGEVLWVNGQREEARRVFKEGRARDASNEVLREALARLKADL